MNHTSIEWVKNPDGTQGYTWNPITGCLNHVDGMCNGGNFPCYAYRLANTRLKEKYLANRNWDTRTPPEYGFYPNFDPFYPRFWPDKISALVQGNTSRRKERGVFVCDMSDLFGIGVPENWTARIIDAIKGCWRDRFYLLTKQPQNLVKFSPFPDNCWVGVTATTDDMLSSAILYLHNIKAKIKYISFEPLLEQMKDLSFTLKYSHIADWLIIGAQTKPAKKPELQWVKDIIEAADTAGIPVFLKDNIYKLAMERPAEDHDLYWEDMSTLRQELPGRRVMV